MPERQRAENEIFQPRLARHRAVAVEGGEHVKRQRLQLQPHIERDEAGRGHHQHHADGRKHDENGEFEAVQLRILHIAMAHDQRQRRAQQDQHLGEAGEAVHHEGAVEGHRGDAAIGQHHIGGQAHRHHGGEGDGARGAVAAHGADQEKPQRADGQDQFRQQNGQIVRDRIHRTSPLPAMAASSGA